MTAFARIITIGKNSDMPKVVRMPIGVGVDGCAITAPVTLRADEGVCPDCKGFGYISYSDGDADCERCDGGGIITIETETTDDDECLSASVAGRPDAGPSSGRPPSSAMPADARAAGDLLRPLSAGTKTHPSKGVPSDISASHSPAALQSPFALPGAWERAVDVFTTIAGMIVFAAIAYFFLVLA